MYHLSRETDDAVPSPGEELGRNNVDLDRAKTAIGLVPPPSRLVEKVLDTSGWMKGRSKNAQMLINAGETSDNRRFLKGDRPQVRLSDRPPGSQNSGERNINGL